MLPSIGQLPLAVTVSGYGLTDPNTVANILQIAPYSIIDPESCIEEYTNAFYSNVHNHCGLIQGESILLGGDQGGPVMDAVSSLHIYSLISFWDPSRRRPSVFIDLHSYQDFIDSNPEDKFLLTRN